MKRFAILALLLLGLGALLFQAGEFVEASPTFETLVYSLITHAPADTMNGGTTVTTAAVPCYHARTVTFFVRDSLPGNTGAAAPLAYADSFSTAQIQFTTDSVGVTTGAAKWMTRSLGSPGWQHFDTLNVAFQGQLLNRRLDTITNGGYATVCVAPGYDNSIGVAVSPFIATARFCRLNLVTINRPASNNPNVTGDADMIGLKIRAHVVYEGVVAPSGPIYSTQ